MLENLLQILGGAVRVSSLYAQLENVEVYGGISRASFWTDMALPEPWHLEDLEVYQRFDYFTSGLNFPRMINLGTFAAGEKNEFLIQLDEVYDNYRVISSVYGLKVEPQILSKDNTELKLTVESMRDGNILYGDLMLEMEKPLGLSTKASKILHRIYISGRAQNGAAIKTLPKVQTSPSTSKAIDRRSSHQKTAPISLSQQSHLKKLNSTLPVTTTLQDTTNTGRKFFPASNFPQPKTTAQLTASNRTLQQTTTDTKRKIIVASTKVKKGQTALAPKSENILVTFRASSFPSNMTIDACAFCLGKNKKVQRDTDLIFFNNPRHESLGVSLDSKKNMPAISLNLKSLPDKIQAVVVCFSIYDEGNRFENNFSNVASPEVVVFANEKIFYEFPVQLGREKIFKALEIYRDNSDWKIHFIGLSSEKDFNKLCEFYGVEIF